MSIFGRITFFADDKGSYGGHLDRLAIDPEGRVLLASILADQRVIKGMNSSINFKKSAMTIMADGIEVATASKPGQSEPPGDLYRVPEATYECRSVKLPHGKAHAIFIARSPGFMPAITEGHLWSDLSSTRFTTPILREWMPYVTEQLRARGLLVEARCYRCQSGLLRAKVEDLDAIVMDGIKAGKLDIGGFRHGDVAEMVA